MISLEWAEAAALIIQQTASFFLDINIKTMVYYNQTWKGLDTMQDIINHILEGNFVRQPVLLEFSHQNIEIILSPDEKYEGSFTIYGSQEELTEGYLFCANPRMECLTQKFIGSKEEVLYRFDASLMEEGESDSGEFQIVSNQGEYSIPFKVTVNRQEIISELGAIKNLFHFANLAKVNWAQAVSIFYSNKFYGLFKGSDKQYLSAYKGLSGVISNEHNVDEFLVAIKKKNRIEYLISENVITIDAPKVMTEYFIKIISNGWGYYYINVESTGDFIVMEKEHIRQEDFLGNSYKLPFYVQPKKLHSGKNFGKIKLYNAHMCQEIEITVKHDDGRYRERRRSREKKELVFQLMKYYEAFRTKKINGSTWMKQTSLVIDRMIATDANDTAARLYRAQLMITGERMKEGARELKEAEKKLKAQEWRPELWCYYLYLKVLLGDEEADTEETIRQVERIYVQNEENWRVAWILLYLSDEYSKSPSKKWLVLEKQFNYGCSGIVLYIEAVNLLHTHPILLMKLGDFELNVLGYAAKNELLTSDMILQIVYLVNNYKKYHERLYKILESCYKVIPDNEVLAAMCRLLMRGSKTDERALDWYRRGIERELKITRLYEYYILSLDLDKEEDIPKIVMMYFAYNSNLDYMRNAYLYAAVHKKRGEYEELYESYRPQIERFIIQQISMGHMNRDLAYLYKNAASSGMILYDMYEGYAKAIFTQRVTIHREHINLIHVNYDKSNKEATYHATGKTIWMPLYGDDYFITLEDKDHNRYIDREDYSIESFVYPDKIARTIAKGVTQQIGFDIWLCEKGKSMAAVTDGNLQAMLRVSETDYIEEPFRQEVRMNVIRYYMDNDYSGQLEQMLDSLNITQVASRNRGEVIQIMVERGMYDKAFEWVKLNGISRIDIKVILRLCIRLLSQYDLIEDKALTYLVYQVFDKRKYDENLLRYLVKFYEGTTRELRSIWIKAQDFDVDTFELSEKILSRILYSGIFIGQRMEIFKDYVAGGAKEKLEIAFLAQCAYDYFMKDEIPDKFIIREIIRIIGRKEKVNEVCKLAFIKYYAEYPEEIDDKSMPYIQLFLRELLDEGKYYKFFKAYEDVISFMDQMRDFTIVEYRSEEETQVVIHYLIERDDGADGKYVTEEMKNMYGGIYAKKFVLFYGEKLRYYITEKSAEKEHLTVSDIINGSEWEKEDKESKYDMLNDIIIAKTLEDYQTVDELLKEYLEREFLADKLFTLR